MKKLVITKISIIFFMLNIYFLLLNNVNATEIKDDDLYCKSDIVMDYTTGNIIFGKNEEEKVYPASTTKILTAILSIENLELDKKITVSKKAYDSTPYGSSVMGVKANEIFTVEQLLYGLLLPSGNDAALVLAEAVSGNEKKFVELMNKKVKEIGLKNTHFENPHGFHDNNHYSTAEDMATLFRYCLKNSTFKKIISTLTYEIPPTNLTDKTRVYRNTSRIIDPLYTSMYSKYFKGGKTGYTEEANGTFVGYATDDETTLIVCSFNGLQNINGLQGRFLDAKKLGEYYLENYKRKEILQKNDFIKKIYDINNSVVYKIGLEDDITELLPKDVNLTNISYDINIDYSSLNILRGSEETSVNNSKVGTVALTSTEFEKTYTYNLIYLGSEEYTEKTSSNILTTTLLILFIILLLIILMKFNSDSKNKKKHIFNRIGNLK